MKTMTRLLLVLGLATGTAWADAEGHAADADVATETEVVSWTEFSGGAGFNRNPDWSPNGDYIAFESDRSGNLDIWTHPLAGGEAVQVTQDTTAEKFPRWSPDGKQILFISDRSGSWNLWVVALLHGVVA